ncbi:heterokaryon incompatibility protein 6, OR allele [Physcomitrium patens]|uniref:Heterokaryon incompatibility domain-containing protein n=1 Tax=Physcomitrium patens TaxID=3218 RepID=A0A2K1JFU7_PHYPA|nr:heterokaryon incompatibility protein 6, OR allele-like [Physcomitrium patens]XP_024394754.1 heterokaryon incompatibility protein 6, OR allele-like [Physcomitrium patens]XP_024394755.1 heterokaryon incompatibility protein 6, OR allele-like [Physcomitrium patens]XP_024394756.1 heterokaryon incompatibility protein 6, OR allele-like [Physcomitrium patens]XP_024394757.1 heterokaryon incompatibility protein 6, OR allele-like [Physcomitrium patens]XP_024394758.1 heterokaryon incompatibility protei|eukprot:XP_024394753.1 heterokaryon incompatibility protein 6, OR allele-like [Physcomitrella patens]
MTSQPESSSTIYTSLDRTRKEIRLLEIVSADPDVTLKLHVASLVDEPVFSALSYVWGYPPVWVDIRADGAAISVTQNFVDAVRDVHRLWTSKGLDRPLESRRLWADAVCINQEDVTEKNFQVPLMKEIYSGAEQVLSWLGKSGEPTDGAFEALQLIYDELALLHEDSSDDLKWLERHPGLCHGYAGDPRGPWESIHSLMHVSYWSRVWIFQEVYLARSLLLISGSKALDSESLRIVQQWHESAILGRKSPPEHVGASTWAFLQNRRSLFESILAIEKARDMISDLKRRQSRIRSILKNGMSDDAVVFYNQVETHVLLLWYMAGVLESTDPKDYIYALLGISGLNIELDYSPKKPASDVYLSFLRLWEQCCTMLRPYYPADAESGILDLWFLIFAGVAPDNSPNPVLELPSWAPNFPAIAATNVNGESYSIASLSKAPVGEDMFDKVVEQWRVDGTSLYCPCIKIDRIAHTGPVLAVLDLDLISWTLESVSQRQRYPAGYHSAIAMHQALMGQQLDEDLGNVVLPTLEDAFGMICLFLILSRPSGQGPAVEDKAFLKRMESLAQSLLIELGRQDQFSIFCEELQRCIDGNDAKVSSSVADILDGQRLDGIQLQLELVLSLSVGHGIAQTRRGYLGKFPAFVCKGDVVCLLKGYDVPVVLREVGSHHKFVGSAFIVEPLGGRSMEQLEALRASVDIIEMR